MRADLLMSEHCSAGCDSHDGLRDAQVNEPAEWHKTYFETEHLVIGEASD